MPLDSAMPHPLHLARQMHCHQRGWTLFEAVLGAGILAAVALGTSAWAAHSSNDHRLMEAQRSARTLHGAASAWLRENDKTGCPTVTQLVHEKYLEKSEPTADPWGERFLIQCSPDALVVHSAGSDGKSRTADDLRFSE